MTSSRQSRNFYSLSVIIRNIINVALWPSENSLGYFTDFKGDDFVEMMSNAINKFENNGFDSIVTWLFFKFLNFSTSVELKAMQKIAP